MNIAPIRLPRQLPTVRLDRFSTSFKKLSDTDDFLSISTCGQREHNLDVPQSTRTQPAAIITLQTQIFYPVVVSVVAEMKSRRFLDND